MGSRELSGSNVNSTWKHVGSILVPLPGSVIDHSNGFQTSAPVDIVSTEEAYVVRHTNTGYA